jgi:lipopolysaccharide export system protein LptC
MEALPTLGANKTARQSVQALMDALLGWLPLLVLSLLLLVTVWLVRTAPSAVHLANIKIPQHVADYDVQQFTLNTYNLSGQLQSSMTGKSAEHYEDSMTTLVQSPKLLMYSKEGRVTTASAKRALSNEDGSEVQLIGQAEVDRAATLDQPQPLKVKSEFLHFFANTDSMQTDTPVVVIRGIDSFQSDKLTADNLNQTLNMHGRVRVVLHPENKSP